MYPTDEQIREAVGRYATDEEIAEYLNWKELQDRNRPSGLHNSLPDTPAK